jgi:D-lactate dehydrogenase
MKAKTMKVTFFGMQPYDKASFDSMNEHFGFEFEYHSSQLNAKTVALAKGSDAVCIFVNDVGDAETLEGLSQLGVKLIALRCAGFNNVDLEAAHKFGLQVVRVPAYSPHAVAEYAVALMLALNRKINRAYWRTRDGDFSLHGLLGFDMYGKTAGIIGTGRIAKVLIHILRGFGMEVVAYDIFPDEAFARQEGFSYVSLDELYARADIVSLHCPLTDQTRHIIDAEAIGKMKEGVMLINTGRGQLIHTEALIGGLKSRKIGSAGLDVYEEEANYFYKDESDKIIGDDVLARLLTFNNVILTSHQGFFTREALENIARTTLQNIRDFSEHLPLANEVK